MGLPFAGEDALFLDTYMAVSFADQVVLDSEDNILGIYST